MVFLLLNRRRAMPLSFWNLLISICPSRTIVSTTTVLANRYLPSLTNWHPHLALSVNLSSTVTLSRSKDLSILLHSMYFPHFPVLHSSFQHIQRAFFHHVEPAVWANNSTDSDSRNIACGTHCRFCSRHLSITLLLYRRRLTELGDWGVQTSETRQKLILQFKL